MNFRRHIIRNEYAKASAFDPMPDIFVSYAKADRIANELIAKRIIELAKAGE